MVGPFTRAAYALGQARTIELRILPGPPQNFAGDPGLAAGLTPQGPPPHGTEWWRYFRCGFGLPPLCDTCVRNGQQCYEVDISFAGLGDVETAVHCSTPEDARAEAWATCLSQSTAPGFFCRGLRWGRARARHSCDYPYMRYPYTAR